MSDCVPNLHMHDTGQCFPLYLYEKVEDNRDDLFADQGGGEVVDGYRRRCAITDEILERFQQAYGGEVGKEDIFYYVYGVLHSPEYRQRFSADLKKRLPRLPLTKEGGDFWRFAQAGRELAEWHLNYESVEPWQVVEHSSDLLSDPERDFLVEKMVFGRPTAEQRAAGEKHDRSTLIYNSRITLMQIPLEAYEYVVNGKPALEWIMDRYQVTVDRASGIRNDPNDWAREQGEPRYILDLFKRVIRVSLETVRIVGNLPALNER